MHVSITAWGWASAAACLIGFLLGCRYRVPAIAAASMVLALVCCTLGAASGLSVASTLIVMACGLFVLQSCYLLGFLLVGWTRGCLPGTKGCSPSRACPPAARRER